MYKIFIPLLILYGILFVEILHCVHSHVQVISRGLNTRIDNVKLYLAINYDDGWFLVEIL